ncbi:MAG: hypothetical protein WD696_02610 [Bryobacteraceae bacterium]
MTPSFAISAETARDLDRYRKMAGMVGAAALLLCAIGGLFSPEQFFRSYLTAYVFVIGIALGSLAIIMLHHLTGGAWGLVIRRLLESVTRTLPLMAVLFLPLAFGVRYLYIWARPEVMARDAILQHKEAYLNVPFFLARAVLYFAVWLAVAYFLNRWSLEQDQRGPEPMARKMQLLSGPGLLLYGATVTFASVDWVMSLDPHWFSTIYGVLFMGGQALSAMAFVIAATVLLARTSPLAEVIRPDHLQDLGKLMLTFVMLWAYFAFSQLLIIWSGNLPEEIPWYIRRLTGGWEYVGLALILFHFFLPFALLLSRKAKRNYSFIASIAGWVIFMRFVDVFWMVVPEFAGHRFLVSWMDPLALAGIGGVWLAFFLWQLDRRPLLPLRDAHLTEALEHGRAH